METTVVVIASTLPLALLLLCALFEGSRFGEPRGDNPSLRPERSHWVALPGAVAVSMVPPTVQADALQILSVLDDLNVYFPDCEHEPRQDGR